MKKYKLLQRIVLGFDTAQDQVDVLYKPTDGVILESDGHTIWVVKNDRRRESITEAHAIDAWLTEGWIAEIPEEKNE